MKKETASERIQNTLETLRVIHYKQCCRAIPQDLKMPMCDFLEAIFKALIEIKSTVFSVDRAFEQMDKICYYSPENLPLEALTDRACFKNLNFFEQQELNNEARQYVDEVSQLIERKEIQEEEQAHLDKFLTECERATNNLLKHILKIA